MSNLGPHEQQLRALREEKAKRRATPRRSITTPPAVPAPPKETTMFDTDNAGAVPEAQPPKKRRERKAAAKIKPPKKTAKKAKKAPAKKAKTAKKKRQTIAVSGGVAKMGLRPGSKLALISDLLARPGGCTRADVMKACKWPSVSMPQQASALGRELVTDKKPGEPTRYTLKPL